MQGLQNPSLKTDKPASASRSLLDVPSQQRALAIIRCQKHAVNRAWAMRLQEVAGVWIPKRRHLAAPSPDSKVDGLPGARADVMCRAPVVALAPLSACSEPVADKPGREGSPVL